MELRGYVTALMLLMLDTAKTQDFQLSVEEGVTLNTIIKSFETLGCAKYTINVSMLASYYLCNQC